MDGPISNSCPMVSREIFCGNVNTIFSVKFTRLLDVLQALETAQEENNYLTVLSPNIFGQLCLSWMRGYL